LPLGSAAVHAAHAFNGPTSAHAILTTEELMAQLPALIGAKPDNGGVNDEQ
jgi:hypothetical protein